MTDKNKTEPEPDKEILTEEDKKWIEHCEGLSAKIRFETETLENTFNFLRRI